MRGGGRRKEEEEPVGGGELLFEVRQEREASKMIGGDGMPLEKDI